MAFNLSFLVKYITRFTEDCFASLVALIFIYDAIREVLRIGHSYPVNYQPNVALDYSCICSFKTLSATNRSILNGNTFPAYLFDATTLNATGKMACENAGGMVVGSGCSTPVYQPDIFFYSVILFLFTFLICMGLQEFRESSFFPTKVNRIVLILFSHKKFFLFEFVSTKKQRFER